MDHSLASHDGSTNHGAHAGHDHHAMMIADFRKRFWVVLVLTAPVMILSPMIRHWLGLQQAFAGSGYVVAGPLLLPEAMLLILSARD